LKNILTKEIIMLVLKFPVLKLSTTVSVKQTISNFHVSCRLGAGKLWRQKVGLPKLQTARGPLTDLPDYSFLDGRPTPLSVGQVKRKELQEELAVIYLR
jgi:hypothetical protein